MKWDGVQSETRHHHRKENVDFKKSAHLNPNAPSYKGRSGWYTYKYDTTTSCTRSGIGYI